MAAGGRLILPSSRPLKARDKIRAHRDRLRRRGLRPIQIWVPDVRSRTFAREAHRQSLLVANAALEREDQAFVDAISKSRVGRLSDQDIVRVYRAVLVFLGLAGRGAK